VPPLALLAALPLELDRRCAQPRPLDLAVAVLRGCGLGGGPGHRRLARAFRDPTLLDAVTLRALGGLLLLAGALTLELSERRALTSATCHERLQSIEGSE
jgi:hypothetical protein